VRSGLVLILSPEYRLTAEQSFQKTEPDVSVFLYGDEQDSFFRDDIRHNGAAKGRGNDVSILDTTFFCLRSGFLTK
jgi:hypothetical protein